MEKELDALFTPWKIGSCEIKNRIVLNYPNAPKDKALQSIVRQRTVRCCLSKRNSDDRLLCTPCFLRWLAALSP